jgi:hypothetical protein
MTGKFTSVIFFVETHPLTRSVALHNAEEPTAQIIVGAG